MTKLRHILVPLFALLAMLCLPSTTAAQAQRLVVDSTRLGMTLESAPKSIKKVESLDSLGSLKYLETPGGLETLESLGSLEYLGISAPLEETSVSADTLPPTRRELRQQRLANFTPNPAKATWCALVFPGGGQIYNHKYWKLPIVYGGFLGCAYALNWNNQMYSDYSQAYLDIMDDDPGTASYEDMLPPRYNVEANKEYLTRVFKNRKDNYRRQRDLSIFCFIGVYLLSVVDAYVDAELSNFDISNDLSVQVRPTTIESKQTTLRNQAYGLQCSFSF